MSIAWMGLCGVLVLAQTGKPSVDELFATEPVRPKAAAPVRFGHDWEAARAEAERTGRRLLVLGTGPFCGWCRVLERRTLTDAEVVTRSEAFVRVELDDSHPGQARLFDEYRIDSIPRSLVLTPEGQVVSQIKGYLPPTEYAAWLHAAATQPPDPAEAPGATPTPPKPVGAPEAEADVVIWSVDSSKGVRRWGDDTWTEHAPLLALLRAEGLRPRVEHMSRDTFPGRWERAIAAGRLPGVLTVDQVTGSVRDLERQGELLRVASQRLTFAPDEASCPDFQRRFTLLAAHPADQAATRRAVAAILRPGTQAPLPGADLPETAGRAEAEAVARQAVVAYLSGDASGLRDLASPDSPQLARCRQLDGPKRRENVAAEGVEVRGNPAIAFARVEMHFDGSRSAGADPVLVVLRREASRWRAFAITVDVLSLAELPVLCRLALRPDAGPDAPPAPRRLFPADGGRLEEQGRSLAWEVPAGVPLAAQVGQVLLDDTGGAWPETRIKVYPGEPRGRATTRAETEQDLTGMSAGRMSWCVWAIGADGQIAASDVGDYLPSEFKY